MTEQVERDGYDQFWDVVESAPVHHGHIVQPLDALRSAWLVRDLTEDDFRTARAATAAMQKDAAMDRLVSEGQRCDAMTPQEVIALIRAQAERIKELEAQNAAGLRREKDANERAMQHLRRAEKAEIASKNHAAFSHEWRERAERAEAATKEGEGNGSL